MLTVDFERFELQRGDLVLDLGCGGGRHAAEALRRGARPVALDRDSKSVRDTAGLLHAMDGEGTAALQGDALRLPFADATFDRVIVSEVLEHIPDDGRAMREVARVLKPSGIAALTVPRWFPETVCWALSREYHSNEGGHVRIYARRVFEQRLRDAGFVVASTHHAHALHSPYWWLRCAFGVRREDRLLPRLYHRALVWQITRRPGWLNRLEKSLDPLLGKSLVVYVTPAAHDADSASANAA